MKKESDNKNSDWIELCEYVKLHILGYPPELKFPQFLAMRLRGLATGNYIANKNITAQAKYDYNTILCTFKICKPNIIKYLHNNVTKIKDEKHKINLIMKIVEDEINDVYIRMQQSKKKSDKIESVEIIQQFNGGAKYKQKEVITNKKLNRLW